MINQLLTAFTVAAIIHCTRTNCFGPDDIYRSPLHATRSPRWKEFAKWDAVPEKKKRLIRLHTQIYVIGSRRRRRHPKHTCVPASKGRAQIFKGGDAAL